MMYFLGQKSLGKCGQSLLTIGARTAMFIFISLIDCRRGHLQYSYSCSIDKREALRWWILSTAWYSVPVSQPRCSADQQNNGFDLHFSNSIKRAHVFGFLFSFSDSVTFTSDSARDFAAHALITFRRFSSSLKQLYSRSELGKSNMVEWRKILRSERPTRLFYHMF